jgi:nucleotide-binding universal stress UspA family protein
MPAQTQSVQSRLPELDRPRILVAVDGSKPSHWAAGVAGRLAAALNGTLKLVHAVQMPPVSSEAGLIMQSEIDQEMKVAQFTLDEAKELLPGGIEVETYVRLGPAVATVLEVARQWPADLIVLGTRGRGKLLQLIMGSTAEGVVRHAPCPVLTVGVARASANGIDREMTGIEGAPCFPPPIMLAFSRACAAASAGSVALGPKAQHTGLGT